MFNRISRYEQLLDSEQQTGIGSRNKGFNVHLCPIGTGEAVIGNSLSNIRKWLLSVNDKTGCVETEASGFSAAFSATSDKEIDALIIRGISDKADCEKNDNYRQQACDNAVCVLKDLLSIIYVQ